MNLQGMIEQAWEKRAEYNHQTLPTDFQVSIKQVIDRLNSGELRTAEKKDGEWVVNEWVKKGVLLSFKLHDNSMVHCGDLRFYDKVPTKFTAYTHEEFRDQGARIVPPAVVRQGSYIGKNVICMPSYVNIGAYVDDGTMVDTWATIGSCAQIGKNCHISGGAGIGGVLEPLQATPVIIEDNCFIGARSEVVEGVIVEEHSVISMGCFIGQSTKIFNRETGEITFGRIPAGSVVVPGSIPSKDGSHSLYCVVIVKQVDEQTRGKVELNDLLRGLE